MVPFDQVCYSKFNPFSKDTTYFTVVMRTSHSFEMILHQFRSYLDSHSSESELKKRMHDPLAQLCFSNSVKQLNMIKTVFETEGLLGWTDEFNQYCDNIIDFVLAEKFYIYTCTSLIQTTASTNAKAFYRERAFHSLLRLFYFYSGLKSTIELGVYGSDLNMESIGELQQYMCGLFDMMMGRLDAYQFIAPHICHAC